MVEQNSSAWLVWRKKGLGSSDAPIIMGVSPYKTRFQLWQEKTSDGQAEQKENFIFEKGHRIEVIARGILELRDNVDWQPRTFERLDKPFIRASMDAANVDLCEGKEFKYVGKDVFTAGVCPEHYFPQVQHQYLVTGFKRITMVLVTDHKELLGPGQKVAIKEIEVPLDVKYCKKLFDALVEFREHNIEKKIAPDLTERDSMPIKDKETKALLKKYASLQKKIKKLEEQIEPIKEQIFEKVDHPFMVYGSISVKKSTRKGSIDFKKIPEVKQLSDEYLEQFRGKESTTRSILCK